ncbi:MAG: hypothetical protein GF383_04310 [Candidatus Lokiarchaeota archaeon]|nr:hypothetical protein [Candidatus Lokiarchaeota archaeon]MBD3338983.1 hypothetical protein [Candidatus Lokiarchaeota archaeon]
MEPPIIGIESFFFSVLLSIILVIYAIMFLPIVRYSFKIKTKNRWNSLTVIILLIVIATFIGLPLSATIFYLFAPLNYYAIVVAGSLLVFFFIFATISKSSSHEDDFNKKLSNGINNKLEKSILDTYNFTPAQEMKRKMIHLFSIFYLAAWTLEPLIFFGVSILYNLSMNTTTKESYINAQSLFEYENFEILLMNGLIIQFFMFICIFFGIANMEIMRLRFKKKDYLFRKTMQTTRRPTEINDISASILLILGLTMSALILTYNAENRIEGIYAHMGVISISVLSDMFAALIGRKWGKHKWPIVKGKSYEGSLAGFLVGFFSALIFVGWVLALIGALIFLITDIVLAKVKISDNASNPILLAITFKILIQFVDPMIYTLPFIKIW